MSVYFAPIRVRFAAFFLTVGASSMPASAEPASIVVDGIYYELFAGQDFDINLATRQAQVVGLGGVTATLGENEYVVRNGQIYVNESGMAALDSAGIVAASLAAGASAGSIGLGVAAGYLMGAQQGSNGSENELTDVQPATAVSQPATSQNQAPVFLDPGLVLMIDEMSSGQTVARVPAYDDSGAVVYSLSPQSLADGFDIDQNGTITTTQPIIFEEGLSRQILVTATDAEGLATTNTITVNLNDINSIIVSGTWSDLGMTHFDGGGYGALGDWVGYSASQLIGFLTTSSTGASFKAFSFAELMTASASQAGITETVGVTPIADITPLASNGGGSRFTLYEYPGPGNVAFRTNNGVVSQNNTNDRLTDGVIRDGQTDVDGLGTRFSDLPNEFDGLIDENSIWVSVDFDADANGEAIIYDRVDNSLAFFDNNTLTRISDSELNLQNHFLSNLDIERDSGSDRSQITNIEFANFDGVGGQDDLEMMVTSMTGFVVVELI